MINKSLIKSQTNNGQNHQNNDNSRINFKSSQQQTENNSQDEIETRLSSMDPIIITTMSVQTTRISRSTEIKANPLIEINNEQQLENSGCLGQNGINPTSNPVNSHNNCGNSTVNQQECTSAQCANSAPYSNLETTMKATTTTSKTATELTAEVNCHDSGSSAPAAKSNHNNNNKYESAPKLSFLPNNNRDAHTDNIRDVIGELPLSSNNNNSYIQPNILENIRLIIKTNGAIPIERESQIEQYGFRIKSGQLAKGIYTCFFRGQFDRSQKKNKDQKNKKSKTASKSTTTTTTILKKICLQKLSKYNRDILFNQNLKIMRFMCVSGGGGEGCGEQDRNRKITYFSQVYEIFHLMENNANDNGNSSTNVTAANTNANNKNDTGNIKLNQNNNNTIYIFMEEFKNRSVSNRVKDVQRVKFKYTKRWITQISSAIAYLQENSVAHRAVKLEHIMLDCNDNVKITSWTRAVFCVDPISGRVLYQPKERRVIKKNHLPAEVFAGSYDPINVDVWSLGVCAAFLCTKQFPFNPIVRTSTFQQQWQTFSVAHQNNIQNEFKFLLDQIFTEPNPDRRIRQQEVQDYLSQNSLETETDDLGMDSEMIQDSDKFSDIIEDCRSPTDASLQEDGRSI